MPEPTLFRAAVLDTTSLTPHLVRVRMGPAGARDGVADLTAFGSSGVADERVVLTLPGADRRDTVERSYTVRSFDPVAATLAVDVAVHGPGPGSTWARRATPGDAVVLSAAMGWYAPPPEAAWQLLVADLSGLPALARIAESSPLPTSALVEVPGSADRLPLPGAASTRWLCGTGNGLAPSGLLDQLRDLELPPGPGYVWCAGEAGSTRALRRHLRYERGLSSRAYLVLGYWRSDQAEWDRRHAALAGGLESVYTAAVARGLSSTDALEAYDDALEEVGL